jgi:hypothetical protein
MLTPKSWYYPFIKNPLKKPIFYRYLGQKTRFILVKYISYLEYVFLLKTADKWKKWTVISHRLKGRRQLD